MNTGNRALIIFCTIITYGHITMPMEIEVNFRNPRSVCDLLRNNGAWFAELKCLEKQGTYSQNLCIARETLKNSLSNSLVYEGINNSFPGMYHEDEKWLSHQFGKQAGQLAINAVQQIKIAEHAQSIMQNCSELSDVNIINNFIEGRLSDNRPFAQLNLSTHLFDHNGTTLLHHAASKAILHKILATMLKHCKSSDFLDAYGRSPLFYAIENGAEENIKLLTEHDAHTSLRDCNGFNPLHIAAQHDQFFCIKKEINIPYNDVTNNFGDTPLHVALKHRAGTKTVKELLKNYGFDCYACDRQGQSYRDLAITYQQPENELLIRAQLDKKLLTYIDGFYHPFTAQGIEKLLRCGANINTQNEKGETLLHSKKLELRALAMLIEYDANIHIKDKSNKTPLDVAIYNWSYEMISLLLDNGALITPEQHMTLTFYMVGLRSVNEMSEKQCKIFELITNSYKQQECCICHKTQEKLDEKKCFLCCFPCVINHKRNFICTDCLDVLPVINNKKQCPLNSIVCL